MKKLIPLVLLPVFAQADVGAIQYQHLYLAEKIKQRHYQKQLDLIQTLNYDIKTQDFFNERENNNAFDGYISRDHYNLVKARYDYLFNSFPVLRKEIISNTTDVSESNAKVSALTNTIRNLSTYINNHVDHVNSSVEYYRYTYPKTPTVVDNIHTRFSYKDNETVKPTIYRVNHFFDSAWIQRVRINGEPVSEVNFTVFKEGE